MSGRKRTVQIKFRVTEEERALIEQKMKLVPTRNMESYLRKMAIDGYIIQIDHSDIKAMTAEIQKIGVNINQILSDVTFALFRFPAVGFTRSISNYPAEQNSCHGCRRVQLSYAGGTRLGLILGCQAGSIAFILIYEFTFRHARALKASALRVLRHAMVVPQFPFGS